MGQGAVGAALPRQGVEGACHEGTQEQQHFNLAKYSLCSSVDLRQMALNGKAETCRAKRWTPCRGYPSTSTFYSTFCALVFPFPFCSLLSPWARKTFDAKLLGHCRATSSLSSSSSVSVSLSVPFSVLLPSIFLSLSLSLRAVSSYSSFCLSSSALHCANFYKVMKSHSSAWP